MATAKVVSINVDKNQNVEFKVEFKNTAFRATRQENGAKVAEFNERKGIDFEMEGALSLSEIVLDYAKKRKIDLTSELEQVVQKVHGLKVEDGEKYENAYTKLVEQIKDTTVNADTLKVEPEDLKELLEEAKPEFHEMVRAAYASHGHDFAEQFVNGTPGVKA